MDSDINYIIRMSLNGDKNNQEILLEKLNPLIYKNIYKYWGTTDKIVEDLVQEGYIVILESLLSFDESRNVHFLHYVKTNLLYFYKNYYRNSHNQRSEVELLTNVLSNEASDFFTFDFLTRKETKNELLNSIKALSPKEQNIIYSFYYLQISMIDICKGLNIPYRTGIGIKQTALRKLKKYIKSGGE